MKGYLVICDSEITYAKRLSEYLSSDCFEGYEVRLFTSAKLLKDSIKDNEIDILIIDEKLYETFISEGDKSSVKYKRVVVLSSDKNSDYIYKYQSAKVLKSYILYRLFFGLSGSMYLPRTPAKDLSSQNTGTVTVRFMLSYPINRSFIVFLVNPRLKKYL